METRTRVAVCHASPVFMSAKKTAAKCITLIAKAASHGANVVVFPETFIPAFPVWSAILAPAENHNFFQHMVQESIYADGEEVQALRESAKQHQVVLSVGISEKVRYSSATLFNSNLMIGKAGEVLVHHRKLMPTFFEKLTWSPGDGHGLQVIDSVHGKIGMLICGENTNPLARYSLMSQGEQIHISTWPSVWPTRLPKKPKSDTHGKKELEEKPSTPANSVRNYDNLAANRTRAAAHCFEAKCFGVLSAAYLDTQTIEAISSASSNSDLVRSTLEKSQRAASMFLDPTGASLPGFVIDEKTGEKRTKEYLQTEEDILYADLQLTDCVEGKQYHDVVSHNSNTSL